MLAPPHETPNLPPDLPDSDLDPDQVTADPDADSDLVSGYPLTWPIHGEEARQEWMQTGELRMAQADRLMSRIEPDVAGTPGGRTVILAGMGSFLGVEGMSLVCHPGRTHGVPAPARELLYPALHGIKHIVWVGGVGFQGGTLTLPALAWLRGENVSLMILDGTGEPLAGTWPDNPYDASLRQRQWAVHDTPHLAGMLAREIVRLKVDAQATTLEAHSDQLPGAQRALEQFRTWRGWLNLPKPPDWQYDLDRLRLIEGRLARHYFGAWERMPLPWAKTDIPRLPGHWLIARSRTSPLSPQGNARFSVDPLNSLLNYGYGCLVSQYRQALIATGLDACCGYLHADQRGRDSLSWDMAELGRARVDHLVLSFLSRTVLHRGDFAKEANGHVLLHPQFVRVVLATCRLPQAEIDGHVRWLSDWLRNADQIAALSAPFTRHDDGPAE